MGKKKAKGNEFYYFMLDRKGDVERKLGKAVPMSELPQHLYLEWKNFPEAKKEKYRAMKERERSEKGKLDCRGVSLRELQLRDEYLRRKDDDMRKDISTLVDFYCSGNALPRATFYVLGASYYVCTDEGKYCPAEVGLVHFSLERGIIKEHNVIIKENLPLGYQYLAMEHCKATHQLHELDPNTGEEPHHAFTTICDFVVKEGGKLPPLYTLQEQMDQAEGILEALGGEDHFKVYSLDLLLKHLYCSTFPNRSIPVAIATQMLNHCGLDYHPGIACQWHIMNQEDFGRHCSLSCARRWVYLICDNLNLAQTYRVVPQEGHHLPRAGPPKGVLVNVPRTLVESAHGGGGGDAVASLSPDRKATQAPQEGSDKMAASAFTSATLTGDAINGSNISSERPAPMWVRRGETALRTCAPDHTATTTSTPTACPKTNTVAALLAHTSLNTSSEDDFPSLGAGTASRGPGGKSGGLTTLGGVGRGVPLDYIYTGAAGIGRGQRLTNRIRKK